MTGLTVVLLVIAKLSAAEGGGAKDEAPFVAASGAVAITVQCGDKVAERIVTRRTDGLWLERWPAVEGCEVQLESIRVRRPIGLHVAEITAWRLVVTNRSAHLRTVPLVVALRPTAGTAPRVRTLAFERHAFFVEGQPILVADTPSRGAILAESAFAPRPLTPADTAHVSSAAGECRGEMIFDLALAPGQTQTLGFLAPSPSGDSPRASVTLDFLRALRVDELFPLAGSR